MVKKLEMMTSNSIAQQREVLGQTAAALAHEIKNPLGSLKLFLSILRQDTQGQLHLQETVEMLAQSVDALDRVVTNMLVFNKKSGANIGPLNIEHLVKEEAQMLAPRLITPIKITSEGNPYLFGNETSIHQMIRNLMINAAQATKYKGIIEITIQGNDPEKIAVQIQDDGPGVALDICEKVWEPFFTTKDEGTGLGLAIVQQVVEQHGGTVEVENRSGAVFTITIPRAQRHG